MKKQKRITGSILEIKLKDNFYTYAQVLNSDIVFFDYYYKQKIKSIDELLKKAVLFSLGVYDYAIKEGRWTVIGKLSIRNDLKHQPNKFIQDSLNKEKFELYNTDTGDIIQTQKANIIGLERAAVWEPEHVEERIEDYYHNRPNKWVKLLQIIE